LYSRSDDDKDSDDSDSSEYSELEEDSEEEGEEEEVDDDNVDDDQSDGDDESDKEFKNTESSANKSDLIVKKKKSRRDFLLNLQSVSGEGSSKGEGGEGIQPIDEYAYDSSDEEDVRYKGHIFRNEMDFTKLYKRD